MLRGQVSDWCKPRGYIDGAHFDSIKVDDLNTLVSPADIMGIEVYTGASAPPQFQAPMSGCGSIVIWTKPLTRSSSRADTKKQLVAVLGLVGFGFLVGALVFRH